MRTFNPRNMDIFISDLSYKEMYDFAQQVVNAYTGHKRDVENIPPQEIDKMARAILTGVSTWNEIESS